MRSATVLILLPPRSSPAEPVLAWLDRAREATAERHRAAFEALGAADVRIISDAPDGRSFGRRLRELAGDVLRESPDGRPVGLVVLGGGAMPLATRGDLEPFLVTALGTTTRALANSYYSADAIAVPDARVFLGLPDLPSDNALPRWLAERARVPVADLRARPHLGLDVDSPFDVVLLSHDPGCPAVLLTIAEEIGASNPALIDALEGVRRVLRDRRAEIVLCGRSSSRTLRWLEQNASCRVRALIEERGLRAGSPLALGPADTDERPARSGLAEDLPSARMRSPRSILGMVLDDRGPAALGEVLTTLGDGAIVDTRVLLAHRLGAGEAAWPPLADRLSSDLLRPDDIRDPWLRQLTAAALRAPIPILLGGHTLVGPGVPLLGRDRGVAGAGRPT